MDRLELGKQLSSASEQADQPQRIWVNPKDLPDDTVPYTRLVIEAILAGRPYSGMGWAR
ncbi:hypothetical protein [Streptomyces sp. NPDC101181]|uniref:hypothetical protein n=1 Tax=Streptomyces sp. NPDC101181 TaxID=3366125 RepID=UPI00382F8B5F